MVELEYVKKRKRKKLAGILTAVASAGIGMFVLVAFLGKYTGTFTVALNTGSVKLSLYKTSQFEDPTSYIKIDTLPPFDLETYERLPSSENIDNDKHGVDYGVEKDSFGNEVMKYFKYTFFIKNDGSIPANYEVKVNITKNEPAISDRYGIRYLDQILRVMVYQNDPTIDEHKYTVYAKKSETPNQTGYGDTTYKEYLSYGFDSATNPFPAFAEPFESPEVVATIPDPTFLPGESKRYTIVAWLEGNDPQAQGEAPEGANLKLGVTINAYENK